jgi:drug/metabolite transporter (DMT)-like permease
VVILVSQSVALVFSGLLVVALGADPPSARRILYAVATGAVGFVGLAAFYRGMKVGAMGVIAPVAATAVLVPVVVGIARGERPSVLQGIGAGSKGGPLWTSLMTRTSTVPLVAALVLARSPRVRTAFPHWPLLVGIGIADTCGVVLFGSATNRGLLSVVAVLGSLYPVVVAALARIVLSERLDRLQFAGAATALVGVALISAG